MKKQKTQRRNCAHLSAISFVSIFVAIYFDKKRQYCNRCLTLCYISVATKSSCFSYKNAGASCFS